MKMIEFHRPSLILLHINDVDTDAQSHTPFQVLG